MQSKPQPQILDLNYMGGSSQASNICTLAVRILYFLYFNVLKIATVVSISYIIYYLGIQQRTGIK